MQVRIYKPIKNPMQSAYKDRKWLLESSVISGRFFDKSLNTTGSSNPFSQIKLLFNTLEEAVNFAKNNNYNYQIIHSKQKIITPKSYSDNFK